MKKFPPHWKQTPVSNDEPWLKPEHSGTPEARTPEDGRTLPPRAQRRGATLNMESAGAPDVYRAEGPAHASPRPYRSLIGRSCPSTLLSGKLLASCAVTLNLTCSLEQVNKNCSRTPPGAGRSVDPRVAGTAASGRPLGHRDGFASSLCPFSPRGRSGLKGLGVPWPRPGAWLGPFRHFPPPCTWLLTPGMDELFTFYYYFLGLILEPGLAWNSRSSGCLSLLGRLRADITGVSHHVYPKSTLYLCIYLF